MSSVKQRTDRHKVSLLNSETDPVHNSRLHTSLIIARRNQCNSILMKIITFHNRIWPSSLIIWNHNTLSIIILVTQITTVTSRFISCYISYLESTIEYHLCNNLTVCLVSIYTAAKHPNYPSIALILDVITNRIYNKRQSKISIECPHLPPYPVGQAYYNG
jgi:hypothetical protein